jgi:hypothetical protein
MQFSDRCAPWKIASFAENFVLYALQFQQMGICPNSQTEEAYVIMDLKSALWRISLMLVLNRSLLIREYGLISALKSLVSIVFMCSLHVMFLSNITPR